MPGAEEEALMRTNYHSKKKFCLSKTKDCAYL
jgi:hypothetical protein